MPKELIIGEDLQKPEQYKQFGRAEVHQALSELGYGPTKMYVDSFYLSQDRQQGVGVLTVTQQHCQDHFGLLRGVDQAEAVAQAATLIAKLGGKIPPGKRPLLTEIEGFVYELPVVEGAILNLPVILEEGENGAFRVGGQVIIGKTVLAEGYIKGQMADERTVNVLIARRKQIQGRTEPLFPPII